MSTIVANRPSCRDVAFGPAIRRTCADADDAVTILEQTDNLDSALDLAIRLAQEECARLVADAGPRLDSDVLDETDCEPQERGLLIMNFETAQGNQCQFLHILPGQDRLQELDGRRPEDLGTGNCRRSRLSFEHQDTFSGARQQIREDRAPDPASDDEEVYGHHGFACSLRYSLISGSAARIIQQRPINGPIQEGKCMAELSAEAHRRVVGGEARLVETTNGAAFIDRNALGYTVPIENESDDP